MAFFGKKKNNKNPINDGEISLDLYSKSIETYYYHIVRLSDNAQVGYCDLRLGHSPSLYYYGNIGYRVLEEYRGHGYAYKACLLLFEIAKKMNMSYLLITASPDNIASNKTCEKLNCQFIETTDVPSWHALYRANDRVKNIYRFDLVDKTSVEG